MNVIPAAERVSLVEVMAQAMAMKRNPAHPWNSLTDSQRNHVRLLLGAALDALLSTGKVIHVDNIQQWIDA